MKANEVSVASHQQSPYLVSTLPEEPAANGVYAFNALSRADVNENNHSLHKFPAKFIPHIPRWALAYKAQSGSAVILDPFCGSGTASLEAALRGNRGIGMDISPLAVLITRAKGYRPSSDLDPRYTVEVTVKAAEQRLQSIKDELHDGKQFGLHHTWTNWFRPAEMAGLLALRSAISSTWAGYDPDLQIFLSVCLSSIAKASSFLSEDQIKVRYEATKAIKDPLQTFAAFALKALKVQQHVGYRLDNKGGRILAYRADASAIPLADDSVSRIITSPPYINAVDYTMTHKYNLFLLGLVQPDAFKDHCRQYIGVTERAVRAWDLRSKPLPLESHVDEIVDALWAQGRPVSRNRSFVVWQYFSGMHRSFEEMYRTLEPDGRLFMVVGSHNSVCGITVPTGELIERLANRIGFSTELTFLHELANRSSMRLNRSDTGGKVKTETVLIFRKVT